MLKQLFDLKRYFSWRELLQNAFALKAARGPLRGYVTTVCFWALMETGFLIALAAEGRVALADFSRKHGLNVAILGAVAKYLERSGYFKNEAGRITFSRKGKKFWQAAKPAFDLFQGYEPLFSSLAQQLKGEAEFGSARAGAAITLARRESQVALGFAELGRAFLFKLMRGLIRRHGFKKVVDLGCQEVELSAFLCENDPELRCLGIDASADMVEKAGRRILKSGLSGQIKVIQGDMFEIDKLALDFSAYDVVAATDLFHGYRWQGDERLQALFAKLKQVFQGRAFLVSELCLPPEATMKSLAYPFPEHELFHALTHQKTFLPGELEGLLKAAGFSVRERYDFDKIAGRTCLLVS